jgi:hypothetical protein
MGSFKKFTSFEFKNICEIKMSSQSRDAILVKHLSMTEKNMTFQISCHSGMLLAGI